MGFLETMKEMEIVEPVISIKSAMSEQNKADIKMLAKALSQM